MRPEIVDFVSRKLLNYDGSHDFYHAKRVVYNTLHASNRLNRELCCICALTHDVCDTKYVNKEQSLNELHTFLINYTSSNKAEQIKNIVRNISYTKLKKDGEPILTPRLLNIWRIVSQADMLEAMGIVGVMRTIIYQGYKNESLDNALNYIEYDLVNCVQYMKYTSFIQEAEHRHVVMKDLITRMRIENTKEQQFAYHLLNYGHRKLSFDSIILNISKYHILPESFWTSWNRELNWSANYLSVEDTNLMARLNQQH